MVPLHYRMLKVKIMCFRYSRAITQAIKARFNVQEYTICVFSYAKLWSLSANRVGHRPEIQIWSNLRFSRSESGPTLLMSVMAEI